MSDPIPVPKGGDAEVLPRWFPRLEQNCVTGAMVPAGEVIIACPRRGDPRAHGDRRSSCGAMSRVRLEAIAPDGTLQNFSCTRRGCEWVGDLKLLDFAK